MRKFLVATGIIVTALFAATPASAAINGPCTASADLLGDDGSATSVDADTTARVTIPRAADVTYRGSITVPEADDMLYSGSVTLDVAAGLDLIPGLDDPEIASWSWGGDTDETRTEGTTDYDLDLPADLGGGVKATATGSHTQAGVTCTGSLDITVGGSAANPASIGAGALTAAGAAGLAFSAMGKP